MASENVSLFYSFNQNKDGERERVGEEEKTVSMPHSNIVGDQNSNRLRVLVDSSLMLLHVF